MVWLMSRENTLPRDDTLSEVKGRIRGNAGVGPALEVAVTYHAGPNKFERFRGFLELISRSEFDFLRRENFFLNDSIFFGVFKV